MVILFGLAVVILGAAVYFHQSDEAKTYDKLVLDVAEVNTRVAKSDKTLEELKNTVQELNKAVTDLQLKTPYDAGLEQRLVTAFQPLTLDVSNLKKDFSIMNVRQSTLEKKIYTKERTINLRMTNGDNKPIEVEVIGPPPLQPLSKGKGQESLIKKAGITK